MTKVFTKSILTYSSKIVRCLRSFVHAQPPPSEPDDIISWPSDELPATATTDNGRVTVCKVEGGLLLSPSTFPFFMLIALEAGGGLFRGLLLLLLYPALRLLGHDRAIKVMAMVSFVGVRKDGFRLGSSVMPKLFLEDVSAEVFEAAVQRRRRRGRCVCVSGMPREMVEPFLKEYLGVDAVVAPELRAFGGYYLGLAESDGEVLRRLDMEEVIWPAKETFGGHGGGLVVGIGGLGRSFDQLFQKYCKEVYVATKPARRRWRSLHPQYYEKPLVFHDGRTAFRPTASATLAMFMWLPLGAPLAVFRAAVSLLLPFSISALLHAALGMHNRRIVGSSSLSSVAAHKLFVCNHRSMVDPLYISAATGRTDLAAATYSISRLSEILSPIRTFRLTRDRAVDHAAMQVHLPRPGARGGGGGGGLVVCPEGTTCREPFLLRFSPLFTELGADVQPVAIHTAVSMFHGTTAGGQKLLDPLYLLLNPTAAYVVQFLDPVAVRGGVGGPELANEVQRRIAEALGYTCTALTRRDKYLALTGNDGAIAATNKRS